MCEQCSAATVTYGEPLPGVGLVRATRDGLSMKSGQWGLVIMNDPFVTWDSDPVPDPTYRWTDEQVDEVNADHPMWAWLSLAGEFRSKLLLEPRIGAQIYQQCQNLGFTDEKGNVAYWLFHRMGELVAANPNPPNENPTHA